MRSASKQMDVVKENVNVDDDDIEASYQDVTDGISVISLKKLKLRDDQFKKLITERLESTNLMVKGITTHRDFGDDSIVRSDIWVEPVDVSLVRKVSFEFGSCVALSCPREQKEKG